MAHPNPNWVPFAIATLLPHFIGNGLGAREVRAEGSGFGGGDHPSGVGISARFPFCRFAVLNGQVGGGQERSGPGAPNKCSNITRQTKA